MPAVELERLEKDIAEVARYLPEPARVRNGIRELLTFYGRSGMARAGGRSFDSTLLYGTPKPVVREIQRSFRKLLVGQAALALETAQLLWALERREARLIAVAILMGSLEGQILPTYKTWSRESKDPEVLQELAVAWIETQRAFKVDADVRSLIDPLDDIQDSNRLYTAYVLRAAVLDPGFEDLPGGFQILGNLLAGAKSDLSSLLEEILASLSQRFPQETARFLIDRIHSDPRAARRIIRKLLPGFPEKLRAEIRETISR